MTQALVFGQTYISAVQSFLQDIQNLRNLNDRYAQDNTLFNSYASAVGARTDIDAADLLAAYNAIVQLLFSLDSGGPPAEKQALYKLL